MKQPRTELELDSYNVESLTYQQSLQMRYTNVNQLNGILNNLPDVPNEAYKNFSMQVTPYLAQLMDKDDVNCPIRLQYLPSVTEVDTSDFTLEDELGEGGDTVPGTSVVHRYPQRVLFLVSNTCGSLCRFCTRKRMVAQDTGSVSKTELQNSLEYICSNTDIEDVLLSGGDPFLFPDEKLDEILSYIRTNAPHVKFIRIGSRLSVQLPTRITEGLCAVIEKNDVQMINIHINHPKEITTVLIRRIKMLRKTGAMIGVQTVLLKGVNDDVNVLRQLFMKCMEIGVSVSCI
jgi:lysine 2,3-aminomutase